MLHGQTQSGFAAKGRRTGQHVVTGNAQGIDVATRIERLAFDLLGAHVSGRSHRSTGLRQFGFIALLNDSGKAEIGNLHLAAVGEHDVFRLDVAMHDAVFGRLGQRGGSLTHDRNCQL